VNLELNVYHFKDSYMVLKSINQSQYNRKCTEMFLSNLCMKSHWLQGVLSLLSAGFVCKVERLPLYTYLPFVFCLLFCIGRTNYRSIHNPFSVLTYEWTLLT